jgi:hypothetical protein
MPAGVMNGVHRMARAVRSPLLTIVVVVALGTWLRWPVVGAGFYTDDAVQIAMLEGAWPAPRGPLDLFRFADTARDGRAVLDFGYDAWWSSPDLRIAMFRPLSSALIALDHRLLGLDATLWHLHSLAWWVALVVAAALFFSRVLDPPAAALALALFAVGRGQTVAVAWLASRSTLVSCTFAAIGLWLHVSPRRRGAAAPVLEAAAFSLALLAGEHGYGMIAYVVARELLRDGRARDRVAALAPAVLPAAACLVASAALGYGARGSGFYVAPFGAPLAFVRAVVERAPALYAELLLGPASGPLQPDDPAWRPIAGLGALALAAVAATWTDRRDPGGARRTQWLLLGAALAVLPSAAALPEDRLLVPASLGASATFAAFLVAAVRRRPAWLGGTRAAGPEGKARSALAGLLPVAFVIPVLAVHLVDAARGSRRRAEWFAAAAPGEWRASMAAEVPEAPPGTQRVVLIAAADFSTASNVPWLRRLGGAPLPRSYWCLGGSWHVHQIDRTAATVIELSVLSDDLDGSMTGTLYRPVERPMHAGDVVSLSGLRVEVLRAVRGNPSRLRFTFDGDLDDESFVFLHPRRDGLKRFRLPEVGGTLRLPNPARLSM